MKNNDFISVNDLEMVQLIGSGTFGKVFQMRNIKNQQFYAVKILSGDAEDINAEDIDQETDLLSDCRCPNITSYFGSFYVKRDVWIVMEFVDGGSIDHLIKISEDKKLDEIYICIIVKEVSKALEYLHSNQKIHRDIKAANILVSTGGEVKLADFGVSKIINEHVKGRTFIGTPFWMAPEIIHQNQEYEYEVDVWSLGITIIEMATGSTPFSKVNPSLALKMISSLTSPPPLEGSFNKNLKELVAKCLTIHPKHRIKAKDILKYKCISNSRNRSVLSEYVTATKSSASLKLDDNKDELDSSNDTQTTNENFAPWAFDTVKVKNTIKLRDQYDGCDTIRKNPNRIEPQGDFDTIRSNPNYKLGKIDKDCKKDGQNNNEIYDDDYDSLLEGENSKFMLLLKEISVEAPEYEECAKKLIEAVLKKSSLPIADSFCLKVSETFDNIYNDLKN